MIATVVTVTFTTTGSTTAYVEYGFDDGFGFTTATSTEAGTSHSFPLMGLTGSTEVYYRAVLADGETSGTKTVTTDTLPNDLPEFAVEGSGHDGWMAFPLIGAVVAPVIVDSDGNIVWYWLDDRGLDVYRVKLSMDGESVLYNAAVVSGDPSPDSAIVRVSLDGQTESTIPVTLLAHDFVEVSDGVFGALVYEFRDDGNGGEVKGNKVIEVTEDGTETTIWSAWDCYDPTVETGDDPELGWTFTNALDYDPVEDVYYVGFRNFSSIVKVDRATGACEWGLGGDASTMTIDGDPFQHQHQFDVIGDTVVVFDNEGSGGLDARAVEYSIDPESGAAEEIWSYQSDPPVQSFVLGDVTRLDDGDTLVTWSVAGQINRSGTDWQLNSEIGYAFGFNTYTPDLYLTR